MTVQSVAPVVITTPDATTRAGSQDQISASGPTRGWDPVAREAEEEEDEAVSAASTPGARRDSGGSVDTVHVTRKVFVEFSASAGSH